MLPALICIMIFIGQDGGVMPVTAATGAVVLKAEADTLTIAVITVDGTGKTMTVVIGTEEITTVATGTEETTIMVTGTEETTIAVTGTEEMTTEGIMTVATGATDAQITGTMATMAANVLLKTGLV